MVVAYVPAWLKLSYLSDLLVSATCFQARQFHLTRTPRPQEASIADISYLFDEGALIYFSVDELVGLVRALFADTPLRTNTITKLTVGHPASR